MKAYCISLFFLLIGLTACNRPQVQNDKLTLDTLDSEISAMLDQVSADTLEKNTYRLVEFGTRHTLSETESDEFGIGAARRWIKSEMDRYSIESGGRLEVEFHRFIQEPTNRIIDPVEIVNVVATLPGTDPNDDRIYVVSGHYDSRVTDVMDAESEAPGANDDASGTVAVLELARVMSNYEFSATIVFMAVAGEEQGLFGARGWANEAKEKGLNIAGMFTNDIIGNHAAEDGVLMDPNKVRLFAQGIPVMREPDRELLRYIQTGGENDLPTRQLARTIKEVSESYLPLMDVWMIYRADRYLRGGDHMAFLDQGYPSVRFSEPHEEFKHQHQDLRVEDGVQYGDLPEFVDYPYVARVTQVNLAALANLARAPQEPRNVGMNTTRLENDTRLRWEASPSAHTAGYEVLWRETTSPVWEHKAFTTDTSYTVELVSKDNYLFGVRSVSEDGHVSSAVYPFPFRE
jgi:Zn-dependent M28 family amino/carboxypeptidase